MRTDIWLPAYVGCGLNVLAIVASFALSRAAVKPAIDHTASENHAEDETYSVARTAKEVGMDMLRGLGATLKNNPHVVLVLCAAFVFPFGEESMFTVILLYISKRYGWSIGDVS